MMRRRAPWLAVALFLVLASTCLHPMLARAQEDSIARLQAEYLQLYRTGNFAAAAKSAERIVKLAERRFGRSHVQTGLALKNLALVYRLDGRLAEAEQLYKRNLRIQETAHGRDHIDVADALNGLGLVLRGQQKYEEALGLYQRSLGIRERVLGADHALVAEALQNISALYQYMRQPAKAEPLLRRVLAIRERSFGQNDIKVAETLHNLAVLAEQLKRNDEALPLLERSIAIKRRSLGPHHPSLAGSFGTLANLYWARGEFRQAEQAFKQSLAISEASLSPDSPTIADTHNNLALLHGLQRNWRAARQHWEISSRIAQRRDLGGLTMRGTGGSRTDSKQFAFRLEALVKTSHRLAAAAPDATAEAKRTFMPAQWALHSEAADALRVMAARAAAGSQAMSRLVRERQDLEAKWYELDKAWIGASGRASPTSGNEAGLSLSHVIEQVERRLARIDQQLDRSFPAFAALLQAKPVAVEELQTLLRPNEALVLILVTGEVPPMPSETFIWAVGRDKMRWERSNLGHQQLAAKVAQLRCGLDPAAPAADPDGPCRKAAAAAATDPLTAAGLPVFDKALAHQLYAEVLGGVGDVIAGKDLLIVHSGALSQLPLHVLLTAAPGRSTSVPEAWLARSHAVAVLPSVSALRALRKVAHASAATRPVLGIGNPLLDGPGGPQSNDARLARHKQSCLGLDAARQQARVSRSGTVPLKAEAGVVDVALVRRASPLPETADEVCAAARALGARNDDVRLGAQATETAVKKLSADGTLSAYRFLHFATHAATAGQLIPGAEPGLLLTPPANATQLDDGYLSASEVAALKLDADMVVLSACNTAAGLQAGGQALSGLARAFLFAGTRSLLVSHWEVDSVATTGLMIETIQALAKDKTLTRSESLRRAMVSLMERENGRYAHPFFWAPFDLVGD